MIDGEERGDTAARRGAAAEPAEAVRPDFFIVGTFKAGTTALYEYLRRHPQVFMPFHKEPHFFGDDLTRHYGRLSLAEYLALFREARPGQRVGEASTWYLYSSSAAREIAAFSPQAQIIILLRHPVDVMYAQHSQMRFRADEDLADFAAALEAEPARRRGDRLPPPPVRPETLFYRHSVSFADQVERYVEAFGRDRMHVILFDDLVADTPATFRGVLEFLGVDPTFRPDFAVHNENKRVRLGALQRLVYNPPGPMRAAAGRLRRYPAVHRLRDAVLRLNSRAERRRPMDPDLRARLLTELGPETDRLAALIGRDLSAWQT
jgi:Sulfotransferase domain